MDDSSSDLSSLSSAPPPRGMMSQLLDQWFRRYTGAPVTAMPVPSQNRLGGLPPVEGMPVTPVQRSPLPVPQYAQQGAPQPAMANLSPQQMQMAQNPSMGPGYAGATMSAPQLQNIRQVPGYGPVQGGYDPTTHTVNLRGLAGPQAPGGGVDGMGSGVPTPPPLVPSRQQVASLAQRLGVPYTPQTDQQLLPMAERLNQQAYKNQIDLFSEKLRQQAIDVAVKRVVGASNQQERKAALDNMKFLLSQRKEDWAEELGQERLDQGEERITQSKGRSDMSAALGLAKQTMDPTAKTQVLQGVAKKLSESPQHEDAPPVSSGDITTPMTQEEYDALPKGAKFRKPGDPQIWTK